MSRTNLINEIYEYKSWHPVEEGYRLRFLDLLQNEPDCFFRHLVHAHITGSALILNPARTEILLLHHRKLDRWLQPGGHADGDEDIGRVAEKEAREETGLRNIRLLQKNIFDLDIHLIPERKGIQEHFHYDIRYLFEASNEEKLSQNSESKGLAWVSVDEALTLTGNEESVSRMLEKAKTLNAK